MSRPSRRRVLGMLGSAPLAAGLLACSSTGATSTDSGVPVALRSGGEFEQFVAGLAATGEFSGTVLLARGDERVLTVSHGAAHARAANGEGTRFGTASMGKMFTAVAVAQLVQQAKLTFQTTVGAHLGGFPPGIAEAVTVHHLLTHTGGVGAPPTGLARGHAARPPADLDARLEAELDRIRQLPARFAPGARHEYSNDGFAVLGGIVARVSGRSFFDHVREHVFDAAGMSSTDYLTEEQVRAAADLAHPHAVQQSGETIDLTTDESFVPLASPAGGAYSTAADMHSFALALHDGRLLEPGFTELVTTGKVPVDPRTPGDLTFYGYGFQDTRIRGHRAFGHSGSSPGHANNLDVFPGSGWISVVLGNRTGLRDYRMAADAIAHRARELFIGQAG